jgi:hypothetical protein
MALDALGLGIGMTGTPKDSTSLVSQAIAQKARTDAEDNSQYQSYLNNISKDPNKYHRLVRPEVDEVTKEFITKLVDAKRTNPRGWMKEAPMLFQNTKNRLNDLADRSSQYSTFENSYNNPNLRLYRSGSIDKISKLMNQATDYRKLPELFNNNGVENNDFVAYDEKGNLHFTAYESFDFVKNASQFSRANQNKHAALISADSKIKTIGTKASVFATRADLELYYKNNPTVSAIDLANTVTVEDNFNSIMTDPKVEAQLIDRYTQSQGTPPSSNKDLFDFYLATVKPSIGTSYTESISGVAKGTTVNTYMGIGDNVDRFTTPGKITIGTIKDIPIMKLDKDEQATITISPSLVPQGWLTPKLEKLPESVRQTIKSGMLNLKGDQGTVISIIGYGGENLALVRFPQAFGGFQEVFMPVNDIANAQIGKIDGEKNKERFAQLMNNTRVLSLAEGKKKIKGFN